MRRTAVTFPLLIGLLFLSGCATYEFDLVRPPELARHVGEQREQVFKLDPLEYRMQAYENRLIVKIFNPTSDPILLLGSHSAVVDPAGESHPLPELNIAPQSWAKLILPPLRPQVQAYGPDVGFEFGVVGYRRWPHGYYAGSFYDPYDFEPRYYYVAVPNEMRYWEWEGETDVRLLLTYGRGDGEFHHEFTFHRRKV